MPQQVPLQRLPYTAPREAFVKALEKDGCVIIQDFTDREALARAKAEVQPSLDAEGKGSQVGALEGRTKTCTRLIGRSAMVRDKYFSDPLYQGLVDHFLTLTTLAVSSYDYSSNGSRDVLLGLFVPGCDTSRANGATRIIPGSHVWGDERPDFGDDGTKGVVDVELEVGEAMVMLGSLYHGGGEYSRMDGKSRTIHIMFCCSGVHRQEEISFLSYPVEDVKTYSPLVQQRLGWKQSEPNLDGSI